MTYLERIERDVKVIYKHKSEEILVPNYDLEGLGGGEVRLWRI